VLGGLSEGLQRKGRRAASPLSHVNLGIAIPLQDQLECCAARQPVLWLTK
jgi:hypothetical protein